VFFFLSNTESIRRDPKKMPNRKRAGTTSSTTRTTKKKKMMRSRTSIFEQRLEDYIGIENDWSLGQRFPCFGKPKRRKIACECQPLNKNWS